MSKEVKRITQARRTTYTMVEASGDEFTVADVLMFADSLRAHNVPPETRVSYMPGGRYGSELRYLSVSIDADTGEPR